MHHHGLQCRWNEVSNNYSTVSGILALSNCRCMVKSYTASLFLSRFNGLVMDVLGSFHVGQVKMESLILLSGMRAKEPLRELIKGSASGL